MNDSRLSSFGFKEGDKIGFSVGSRIVCIDTDGVHRFAENYLILNKVYVIEDLLSSTGDNNYVKIEGVVGRFFSCRRFISLKEYRRRKLERIKNECNF
jgi:hypothetical protein